MEQIGGYQIIGEEGPHDHKSTRVVRFTATWFTNSNRDYPNTDRNVWIMNDASVAAANKFRSGVSFWLDTDPAKPTYWQFTNYTIRYASPGFDPSADTTLSIRFFNNGSFVGGDNFGTVLMVDDEGTHVQSKDIDFSIDLNNTACDEIVFIVDRPTSVVWDNGNAGQSIEFQLSGLYLLP